MSSNKLEMLKKKEEELRLINQQLDLKGKDYLEKESEPIEKNKYEVDEDY